MSRVSWGSFWADLTSPEVVGALRLSLLASVLATVLALLLGIPLAWVLARVDFRGKSALRALVMLPLVLPPVVAGLALLAAFGRRGLIGRYLESWFSISIPFTTAAVVLAETFIAMPFLVLAVESGMRSPRSMMLEEAAATLGARSWLRFFRLSLPLARPALLAGTAVCWARAIGEFGATITFAGNFPEVTQTLPLAVYLSLQRRPEAALAMGVLLLALAILILLLLRDRWYRASP